MNRWKELDSLESWMSQTEKQQDDISERVLEKLPGGFILAESFSSKLRDGKKLSLPCFYDEKHETPLILVPGGSFLYGLSSEQEESIQQLCTEEEWAMIHPLLQDAKPSIEIHLPPFLMSRFPVFNWVAEENIDIDDSVERPDFSSDEGPFPCYLTSKEIDLFLIKSGYRMPYDWEWEFVAKGVDDNLLICGNEIPSERPLKEICITSFGNPKKNNKSSNGYGISGLAIATLTSMDQEKSRVAVRGGAAGFYPFQGPGQWAMLLTSLRMPLENMPGGVAGLRLCLDVPAI